MDQIQQFSKPLTKPNAKPKMRFSPPMSGMALMPRSTRPSIRQSTTAADANCVLLPAWLSFRKYNTGSAPSAGWGGSLV